MDGDAFATRGLAEAEGIAAEDLLRADMTDTIVIVDDDNGIIQGHDPHGAAQARCGIRGDGDLERHAMAILAGDGSAMRAGLAAACEASPIVASAEAAGKRDARKHATAILLSALATADDWRRSNVAKAATVLCRLAPVFACACTLQRTVSDWIACYPETVRHASEFPSAAPTLVEVAAALRSARHLRRCALYALYSLTCSADDRAPRLPYASTSLGALEAWVREQQQRVPRIPSLPLDLPVAVSDAGNALAVVRDALPAPPMAHADMVGRLVDGNCHVLYEGPIDAPVPSASDAAERVNAALTAALVYAVNRELNARDRSGIPLWCACSDVDVFAAYPGTRVVLSRHARDESTSTTFDLGLLLCLDAHSPPGW